MRKNFELRLRSFGFCRDGFVAGAECGAFCVEGVEFAKDGFEGAFAGGFLSAEEAALILVAEIGLDRLVVTIGDADELRREAVTKDVEFVQLGFEGLGLARSIPFANDGLERDVGPQRQVICSRADLDGGAEGVVEFLPAFVGGPVLGDFALGEMDELKGPPLFDFKRALKRERIEKGKLPVVVLREPFEHGAHGILAVLEFQEFCNEELRTAAIDVEGFAPEEIIGGPAQIFEREHGVTAQNVTGGLERVLHRAVGAGEREHEAVDVFARQRQDNLHFAHREKLFGDALDEPGRKVGGAGGGVAIGEFEQQSLGHRANVFAASHEVRKLHEIFPAIAEAFAVDCDRRIGPGREIEGEMDSAAPWCGIGEFAIKELFDALGGNGEQGGVEDNHGRVGAEVSRGFGWAGAAGVMDRELAADAASESGVLGVGKKGNEQEETE